MRGVGELRGGWRPAIAVVFGCAFLTGCISTSDGPSRLYPVDVETQFIRDNMKEVSLVQFSGLDEASRVKYRNDWIGARMYAIDINYSVYEAALTRERQNVGFGAAAATLGLTTASGLVAPVATKNLLTGLAGFVTGTRAAYDNDVLLAHTVEWVQSQMQANRAIISTRILNGMKLSTRDYPLAAALSDIEAYYRAGTFTGGLISTSQVVAADAQSAESMKAEAIQVTFSPITDLGKSIRVFWRSSATNKKSVEDWVDNNTNFGSVPVFLRSNSTVLYQQIIKALSIPTP
jgi:hypothetical protein